MKVAVKRVPHESWHGMKEFIVVVVSMRQLRHPDLVQSAVASERDKYFSWSIVTYQMVAWINTCMIVARVYRIGHHQGSSFGVIVLHEDWEQIVHRQDIKVGNVLLDDQMNGRLLGDLGVARLYDHGSDVQTTHVVCTTGYLFHELG
uniref:Protein kinase domain-containing protein n=1 Tax=Oryza barthii TaxID=65489 RepID=A0A0D3HV00_9ORYZ